MGKRLITICSVLGFVVLGGTWAIHAQTTTTTIGGKQVTEPQHVAVNRQTSVSCNFCFTCGGDWPIFAGAVRSSPASPVERGSGCSGGLITRTDSAPFLCCK